MADRTTTQWFYANVIKLFSFVKKYSTFKWRSN